MKTIARVKQAAMDRAMRECRRGLSLGSGADPVDPGCNPRNVGRVIQVEGGGAKE